MPYADICGVSLNIKLIDQFGRVIYIYIYIILKSLSLSLSLSLSYTHILEFSKKEMQVLQKIKFNLFSKDY